jgi:hypothetical protein
MTSCSSLSFKEELRKLITRENLQKRNLPLSDRKIDDLIDSIVEITMAKNSQKLKFPRTDAELTKEVLAELEIARKLEVKAVLHDAIVVETAVERIAAAEDPVGALQSFLVGTVATKNKTGGIAKQEGSKLSIDTMQVTEKEQAVGNLQNELEEQNVLEIFRDEKMEETILDVGYKILKDPQFKPTGPKEEAAVKIANILIKQWEARSKVSMDNAAYKGKAEDSFEEIFGMQGHDQTTLYKADKDEWKKFMKNNMDTENSVFIDAEGNIETRVTDDNIDSHLDQLWDTITTGKNMIYSGDSYAFGNSGQNLFVRRLQNVVRKAYSGKGNLGAKESTPAQVKFKSGKAAKEYKDKYIKRSLVESVYNQVTGQTNNNVLLRELGTNPRNQLKKIYGRVSDIVQTRIKNATDPKEKKFQTDQLRTLEKPAKDDFNIDTERYLAELDGSANQLDSGTNANIIAAYSRNLRIVQVMSKLGQATISAFGDIAFQVAALTNAGMPGLSATAKAFGNILDGLGGQPKIRKKYANSLGLGIQSFRGSLLSKVGAGTDNFPGMMTRLQNQFFKFNLMSWWNDSHAIGMSFTFMNHLASHKKLSFDKLMPEMRKTLEDYRIGEKEWDILRKYGIEKIDADDMMTVQNIKYEGDVKADVDAIIDSRTDSAFQDMTTVIKGETQRYKFNKAEYLSTIKRRFVTMINDTSRNGVMIPGAWEQALMKGSSRAGSYAGEFRRQLMLFKTFPVTVLRKALLNKVYSKSYTGKRNYAGMATLIVGSSILGAMAIQTKEAFKGREPRDMFDDRFWIDALLQGGSLGIYGDTLLGNYRGRSPLEQLAGPGINTLTDILGLVQTTFREPEKLPRDATRFVKENMPYQNLFYGKAIQDYLLYNFVMELSNPGYLRREEQRIMRDRGQSYMVPRMLQE